MRRYQKRMLVGVLFLILGTSIEAQKGGDGGKGRGGGGGPRAGSGGPIGRPGGAQIAPMREMPAPKIAAPAAPAVGRDVPRPEVREQMPRVAERMDRPERAEPMLGTPALRERVAPEQMGRAPEARMERVDRAESRRQARIDRERVAREQREERRTREARTERVDRAESRRQTRIDRERVAREQREERRGVAARADIQAERQVAPERLTRAQQQELAQKTGVTQVTQFAEKQIAQNPKLAAEINQTRTTWQTDTKTRRRWHNDWKRYSYYHSYGHFHFNTFINFVFFAPWYLFPFTFYPTFYSYYPVYWVPFGWFNYPIYWNYGYAHEIGLVTYVDRRDFDVAIDQLERRLDGLENEVLNQKRGFSDERQDLRASISEVIWLLNDLKKIILEQASLPRPEMNRLVSRINGIKDRGHNLIGYLR